MATAQKKQRMKVKPAAKVITKKVPIGLFRLDGGTQARATTDPELVDEYTAARMNGAAFPPVDALFDGEWYWPWDGEHRLRSAVTAGDKFHLANVHYGTQRDAQLKALSANKTHGLRRTNADKRNAVERMLRDGEWSKWSDRAIAEHIGVSNTLVGNLRGEFTPKPAVQVSTVDTSKPDDRTLQEIEDDLARQPSTRTGRDGKSYPATQPKRQEPAAVEDEPEDSSRRRVKALVSLECYAYLTGATVLSQTQWQDIAALSDAGIRRVETLTHGGMEVEEALETIRQDNVRPTAGPPRETAKPTALAPDPAAQERATKLEAALTRIDSVLGGDFRAALTDGRIRLADSAVSGYAEMDDENLAKAAAAIQQGWDVDRFRRVIIGEVDGKSTVVDLINKAIATGGKYTAEVSGYAVMISRL